MALHPILAALSRHKPSVALITLQIALTLAIVCNAVFIIGQRIEQVNRPTGLDEAGLFLISQMFVDAPTGHDPASRQKLGAMQQTDLATLRGLPDVQAAALVNTLPLLNAGYNSSVGLRPDQQNGTVQAFFYGSGEQALKTLGLRLIVGRNFQSNEIEHAGVHGGIGGISEPSVVIVTQTLAHKLFPRDDALGKVIYFDGRAVPSTVVGIVARLESPFADTPHDPWNSVLEPIASAGAFTRYAVRAKPGRLGAAMREAPKALHAVNPMRIMNNAFGGLLGIHSFAEIRAHAYRADRGMAILMGVICVILLCVTGAGIVGLASFWVGQRRKQIGIRRALGATQRDILRYFQLENLMIASGGVVLGAILGVGLNLWLMRLFSMDSMPVWYVLVGIVALLVLGQVAVFMPARRASNVSPVEATRSV